MSDLREPLLHSQVTDALNEEHPLAFDSVYCAICGAMLHACNNECMLAWVETGRGMFCLVCFVKATGSIIHREYGLP